MCIGRVGFVGSEDVEGEGGGEAGDAAGFAVPDLDGGGGEGATQRTLVICNWLEDETVASLFFFFFRKIEFTIAIAIRTAVICYTFHHSYTTTMVSSVLFNAVRSTTISEPRL